MWRLTLENTTQTSYIVYLVGKVEEAARGDVLTAKTKNFDLPPGTKRLRTSELGNVNIDYQNKEIKDMLRRTGSVPSGNYNICITVYSYPDNERLGDTCISHNVNNLTIPILISPLNKSLVSDGLPVFNWMPPSPVKASQRITYSLRIVEILSRQTAFDAMLSNPAWYEKKDLTSTISVYSIASRNFVEGSRYAWKVKAFLDGTFINESEVWEFNYSKKGLEAPDRKAPPKETRQNIEKGDKEDDNYGAIYNMDSTIRESKKNGYLGGYSLKMKLKETQVKKKTPLFLLTGTSIFYGENSNRQGTGSEEPDDIIRWELSPTLYVRDVPLLGNFLLSTEQQSSMQNINNFAINLDPDGLIERIKNKAIEKTLNPAFTKEYEEINSRLEDTSLAKEEVTRLKARLEELDSKKQEIESINTIVEPSEVVRKIEKQGVMIPGLYKLLTGFRNFGIGTNYPEYTAYTLSGIPLTGANIEFNYGLFYFAITGLRNLKAIQEDEFGQSTFERKLIGTRLGLGKFNSTHFYITYLYGWDNENSVKTDSNAFVTPVRNHLLGLETKVSLMKNNLDIEGEIGASLLTRDVTSPDIQNSAVPGFVQKLFGTNISSSLDYFYRLKTLVYIDKTKTKLSAGIKMIGPGYESLGAPNIRNDNLGFEINLDQSFLKNQISLSGYFKRDRDNLISSKTSTTTNTYFGIMLGLRFAGWPTLQINYAPYFQNNDQEAADLNVDNKTSSYTLSTAYSHTIPDLFAFTNSVALSLNETKILTDISDYTNSVMINQSISFLFFPLTITTGFGMTESRHTEIFSNIKEYNFSVGHTTFEIWENTAGLAYSDENETYEGINNNYRNLGIFINSSIPIWEIGNIDLRAEKNIYKDKLDGFNNFDEFIFTVTLTNSW